MSELPEEGSILIVDDEEMVLTSLSSFLTLETDYDVVTFTHASEALKHIESSEVDLVISDFLMPEMDGLQFLSRVRDMRPEEVLAWATKKLSHEKKVPKYEALPEWLVRGNVPVPLTQGVQTQATSTQVHGFLLSLIDGKRTLRDIARIAVERRLLEPQDAEATIRNFLIKMADESRRLGYQ